MKTKHETPPILDHVILEAIKTITAASIGKEVTYEKFYSNENSMLLSSLWKKDEETKERKLHINITIVC